MEFKNTSISIPALRINHMISYFIDLFQRSLFHYIDGGSTIELDSPDIVEEIWLKKNLKGFCCFAVCVSEAKDAMKRQKVSRSTWADCLPFPVLLPGGI